MKTAFFKDRILFALSLFFYAFFGSPTPDAFGLVETALLFLLFISLRVNLADHKAAVALLAYGLSVPLAIALIHGYPLIEIVRDVVPFLFLLMPVLYFFRREQDILFLSCGVIFIGVVFSVRALISLGPVLFTPQAWLGTPPDLLYLTNSPEVLFSCLALFGFAAQGRNSGRKILFPGLALIPLLAMATQMQRASLFYMGAVGMVVFLSMLWRRPARAVMAGLAGLAVILAAGGVLDEIFRQLIFKTQSVGLNSRSEEWKAVLDEVSASPFTFLFGLGWGAEFENPAVGGLRVSFTHSLISSLLLKTGLSGIVIFFAYGLGLLKAALPRAREKYLYLYALAGPLLIGLMFYASYKSLGYGLLLMILAALAAPKKLELTRGPVP